MNIVRIALALSCLGAPTLSSAAPLKESYWLSERGALREFEVARDEVHVGRLARKIAAKGAAEQLRATLKADGGELVLYPKGEARDESTRRLVTKQLAVKLAPEANAASLAAAGVRTVRSFGAKQRWWLVE